MPPFEGLQVVTLQSFFCDRRRRVGGPSGRPQSCAKGRGGHFDPAAVQHLVAAGKLQLVPDRPSDPHGYGAPPPARRYNP